MAIQNATDAALTSVRRQIDKGPITQDVLWMDHAHVWQKLGWTVEQMRLWVRCQTGIVMDDTDKLNPTFNQTGTNQGQTLNLSDEIYGVLAGTSRPIPITQLMTKLPAGVVVTEPMLRAAIAADSRLQITGPLIKIV